MMRALHRLLCKLGLHRWGLDHKLHGYSDVCRYCKRTKG